MSAAAVPREHPLPEDSVGRACTWRDLRVTTTDGGRVETRKKRRVLIYWVEHGTPEPGYLVSWPPGCKSVDMMGFEDSAK